MSAFIKELTDLLNRHGKDAETNTADYILADMLNRQIDVFANAMVDRDEWPNTSIGTNICAARSASVGNAAPEGSQQQSNREAM